ncbi:MAG TPA: iron ABC transporter substrate-binding protein [Clostridiales bacterium]|nr:iron ABC transporter substrate-binding protein [Clostridiales bacterium]
MKKFFALLLLSLLACFTFTACAQGEEESTSANGESMTITDMADRTVTLNSKPERLLILGSALRLYTYIAGTERLVGVEKAQQDAASGRPYIIAHPELSDLPLVGEGFPADPDPERIAQVDPDVIIAGDIMDTSSLEDLQNDLGIPVIITKCGTDPIFDDTTYRAMEIIGQVTDNEDRVTELISYMDQCQTELKELTQNIDDADKPTVYVGGLAMKGIQGIDSTNGQSTLLQAINAKNVADELGAGHFFIDKEQLLTWDPDILFLDEQGLSVIKEDYAKNPAFYKSLTAVKEAQVYGQLPYTNYYSNLETALADLYYIGKVLYPDAFTAIDPVAKADEIYEFMLGEPLYDEMATLYGGFTTITLGE